MADSDQSAYTPALSDMVQRRKQFNKSIVSTASRSQRNKSPEFQERSRSRCRSRNRQMIGGNSRNSSCGTCSRNKRRNRSRSRVKGPRSFQRKRNQSAHSSSTSMNSIWSSSSEASSKVFSNSEPSSSNDSRTKIRRHGIKRRTYHAHRRRSKTDNGLMERFIDAISNHGRNTFVGAQDVIPIFDPSQRTQLTKSWLKKVNETAAIYRWSDKQTIFHALPKLSGLARHWYEGLSSINLSWKQWQKQLLQTFPDDRNYADKLMEMLSRRSRREESLEEYFYDKAKLVSHCKIKGKAAVDCIIHGIFDHNIKLNAQGANFKTPDKLLKYLRSISIKNFSKDLKKPALTLRAPSSSIKRTESSKDNRLSNATVMSRTCYNCSELGHIAPKCHRELQKCLKCNRLGHKTEYCRRDFNIENKRLTVNAEGNVNKVQRITAQDESRENNIYHKIVKVNNTPITAFVDFGSQCTIIKNSIAKELNLPINCDTLPLIRGFAFGTLTPIGRVKINICIDFVEASVEAFVVPDEFLNTDMLLGQNVTEMSDVVVFKTNSSLILYSYRAEADKRKLFILEDITVRGLRIVKVCCDIKHTGHIYLPGNTSFKDGEEIMTLPGVYYMKENLGYIPVICLTNKDVILKEGRLLARVHILHGQPDILPTKPLIEFQINKMN